MMRKNDEKEREWIAAGGEGSLLYSTRYSVGRGSRWRRGWENMTKYRTTRGVEMIDPFQVEKRVRDTSPVSDG